MIILRQILTWNDLTQESALRHNEKWAASVWSELLFTEKRVKITWLADDLGVTFLIRKNEENAFDIVADEFVEFILKLKNIILEIEPDKIIHPLRVLF